MSIFDAYMAKYCNAWQHQLSHLYHMREGDLGYIYEGPSRVSGSFTRVGVREGTVEVGRIGERAHHASWLGEEGASTSGRGGGFVAFRRVAMERPPGRGRGALCCLLSRG